MPGNKWRKLKYNIVAAQEQGSTTILTFGGAYSNHIRATAAAGYYFGLSTIGVIRGEEHLPLNPVLSNAVRHGMRLEYLDRSSYRDKDNPTIIAMLRDTWGDFYLVPEGGSNCAGMRGCAEIPSEIAAEFDVICCSSGTGATLGGIATALAPTQRAVGFSALKGGGFLADDVRRLQERCGEPTDNWSIETAYHFGGYARRKPELDGFIEDFRQRHGLVLDWVYEAKMMYGIFDLVQRGAFPTGTRLVAVIAG
jgi:1-aminocyclopropane-1-carboxylate deaminase